MSTRYTPLPQDTYVQHRNRLRALMPEGSMAVLNSNDVMPTNADGTMPFRQNNDLLYLSGVDQEESVLLLFPSASQAALREVLFLRETNAEIAIWEGDRLTAKQATELSGIKTVKWLHELEPTLQQLIPEAEVVLLNSNEHLRQKNEVQTRDDRFREKLMRTYPLHRYGRLAPLMHRLRSVKSRAEIAQMQKACDITGDAFTKVLSLIKPGMLEYELEAEFCREFLRRGSRGFAYAPIIASGANACVLHYVDNAAPCRDGDLVLMDVGAEYGNYASDMTRTIPVNGKFTPRQREVYSAVLRVMRSAMDLLKPGVLLGNYHKQVGQLMEQELIGLGLLTAADVANQAAEHPAYKKYFMHGTSHFIGLDVHDVGLWHEPIQAGMVFTVEPGIYIREEGIGIRLENDILITEDGYEDLMAEVPLEIEAIEAAMAKPFAEV